MSFSRREGARFNRGRIAAGGAAPNWAQQIFSGLDVVSLMTTEPGMVSTSGANVTSVRNQGTVGLNWSPVNTVTYTASDPLPGGLDDGTILYGGTTSMLTNTHNRVGPSTQPFYRAAIVLVPTWVSAQRLLCNGAGNNNNQALIHSATTNALAGVNSSGGNADFGMPFGEWVLLEQQFSGTNLLTDVGQDYIKARGLCVAGVNFGAATGRTGQGMGRGLNVEQKFYIEVNGKPTMAMLTAFAAEIERRYGSAVVRAPISSDTHLIVIESQSNGESQGVTTDTGPGFVHSVAMSQLTRTSPTADRNTCPLILRRERTRHSVAPTGKWGYELQATIDLVAATHSPACVIKNSFGSSSLVDAMADPIYSLVTEHFGEFAGELDHITKAYLWVDRGNTDSVEGISAATAQSRYNTLFADRIALIKAQCPLLTNADIYILSNEISINTVPAPTNVNLGRVAALADQVALGYNTFDLPTSDLTLNGDNTHWGDTPNNTIGSRGAVYINANW